MLRYRIQQLQNGKWYGEMYWGCSAEVLNVDVVNHDRFLMEGMFNKGVQKAIQMKIREFLNWRYNSLSKAGRELWAETQYHMNAVSMMASKLEYVNQHAAIRLLAESLEHLACLKPKTTNYLWEEMEELMEWIKAIQYRVDEPFIEICKKDLLRNDG